MNLILNLPPEIESRLVEAAEQTGRSPEDLALEALGEKLSSGDEPAADRLSFDRWQKRFRDALAALPASKATFVDDSRESIYEDRGE
jgi:hypothetical protein